MTDIKPRAVPALCNLCRQQVRLALDRPHVIVTHIERSGGFLFCWCRHNSVHLAIADADPQQTQLLTHCTDRADARARNAAYLSTASSYRRHAEERAAAMLRFGAPTTQTGVPAQ